MKHSIPLSLAVITLAGAISAQTQLSTVNPFLSNNWGSAGGGVYFDLTASAGILISQLDLNIYSGAGTAGTIEVYTTPGTYVGNEANAGVWTLGGSAAVTSAGRDQITTANFATPITIPAGTHGIAICAVGLSHAYTNGTGANQQYSDPVVTLNLGTATNVCFAGVPFTPRVWNGTIYYNPANGLYPAFTQDVTSGTAPLTVNFTDQTFTSDPNGVIIWLWDFDGDGNPDSTLQNPSHTYTTCGLYDVTLEVLDATHGFQSLTKTGLINVAPSYCTFGAGCPNSAGNVTTLTAPLGPKINRTFTVTLNNLPNNIAFMVFGVSNTTFNGAPLPIDMAQFGMPGCDGLVAPEATTLVLGSGGSGTWNLPIPNNPAFVGTSFYNQALVVDPGVNPLGAVMSDGAGGVVGQ